MIDLTDEDREALRQASDLLEHIDCPLPEEMLYAMQLAGRLAGLAGRVEVEDGA